MGVSSSGKTLSVSNIDCLGSFGVTLSLTAEPDIVSNPTDIVLILDRSGSMEGSALENLKIGANKFIDIIDEATDSTQDGVIGFGSRIGIVSFSSTAVQDAQLITSVADLKNAVDALTSGGLTNHADAFTKAVELFDPTSTNAKVMIMFTDGVTTVGADPNPVAAAARAQGIIIYCIGLSGNGGIDEQSLKDWASDPDSAYVSITPDEGDLERLFEDLAKNIAKPGATDIKIDEVLDPCFRITNIAKPAKGKAVQLDDTSLSWTIDELGVTGSEGAVLDFTVEHVGPCFGTVEVNKSITYKDNESNSVTFPSPEINIDCDTDFYPEECPQPVDVSISGCEDSIIMDAGAIKMESAGRMLQLDVTIKNVCPDRRVALGIMLNELDANNNEYKRGLKTITVPAHTSDHCRDVTVKCIKFVLPEDLDVSGGTTDSICNDRRFVARFVTHYIDNDFDCCNALS